MVFLKFTKLCLMTSSVLLVGLLVSSASSSLLFTEAFVAPTPLSLSYRSPSSSSSRSNSNIASQLHMKSTSTSTNTSTGTGTSQAASQNLFGTLSDAFTGAAFGLLHAFDADPIQDSSKNLRVLWVRALLNARGLIDDDVAEKFLPPTTRGLVTSKGGSKIFDPIIKFTEWIQARTDFIDAAVEHFLSALSATNTNTNENSVDGTGCNIVMFGAGYDTRALRFRNRNNKRINFFEVDLPDVCEGKQKLYQTFKRDHDPDLNFPTLVPLDLNSCGGDNPVKLTDVLREKGMDDSKPTLFVSEAVLFYVNEDAVRNIMQDLFDYAKGKKAETLLCFTDSLKPFVSVPFSNEARIFFDETANMDLLEHRSRWGGAVHFCLASSRRTKGYNDSSKEEETPEKGTMGNIGKHISTRVGGIVHSYTPTQSNNPDLIKNPSFENVWYAVAYPWQIDGYESPLDAVLKRKTSKSENKPFATRLWGEPIVIYRDDNQDLVAMADVCPHRSVPLSMGKVENGELRCFYHGWRFGQKGECVDVPTLHTADDGPSTSTATASAQDRNIKFLQTVTKANCGNNKVVVEHEGLVYIWRGNTLEADPSLLPTRRKGDMETVPIDTVLDYSVDYSYIVENNLDSPHLFYLHDGSVPPIESIGMVNKNLPRLRLTSFTDDCGMGHLGRFGNDRPKKLIRFDPPNIVRHGGVSGFEEEFHVVPIAPHRTRVLLRQHLPRGPILSTITGLPGMLAMLTLLVNNWNYHISLEDSCVMNGQANRIEDWGSPRMTVGGLGDDLIKRYWNWRSKAHEKNGSPYVHEFSNLPKKNPGIPTGTSFGDNPTLVSKVRKDSRLRNTPLVMDNLEVDPSTGNAIGSWGIKQTYLQDTPAANFPPINYKQYASMLVFDDIVKGLLENKEDCPPVSRKMAPPVEREREENTSRGLPNYTDDNSDETSKETGKKNEPMAPTTTTISADVGMGAIGMALEEELNTLDAAQHALDQDLQDQQQEEAVVMLQKIANN